VFCTLTLIPFEVFMYALPTMFSVVPWCCDLPVCFSDFLNDGEALPVAHIVTE
jgi:hypothetical protein